MQEEYSALQSPENAAAIILFGITCDLFRHRHGLYLQLGDCLHFAD